MTRPNAQLFKAQVISFKAQVARLKFQAKTWNLLFVAYVLFLVPCRFCLTAFGFLLTSFGTGMRLLWRRSVQVLFSMASSFLRNRHQFFIKYLRLVPCTLKLVLFSFLLIACSFSAQAQKPPAVDTTYSSTDTSNIYYDDSTAIDDGAADTARTEEKINAAIIFLNEDSVKSLRRSKGFEYMAYIDSLLKAREIEKKRQPEKKYEQPQKDGTPFWDLSFIKVICWAVAIGVVIFVLYRLFLGQGSAFASNAKSSIPQVDMEEELSEDDLEGQLKKAIQAGNYRLATRYLFLKTLQQLANKNAIALSTEKTNIQYSYELRGKSYADSFARLCLLYEYVWFGEFDINEQQFASIQQQQQQLEKAI